MLTVYSKNNCPNCEQAKALLDNSDIQYETIMVEDNPDAMKFLLAEGHRTMPQIYKDGELFVVGGHQGLMKKWRNGEL
jgi:glutaredoxin